MESNEERIPGHWYKMKFDNSEAPFMAQYVGFNETDGLHIISIPVNMNPADIEDLFDVRCEFLGFDEDQMPEFLEDYGDLIDVEEEYHIRRIIDSLNDVQAQEEARLEELKTKFNGARLETIEEFFDGIEDLNLADSCEAGINYIFVGQKKNTHIKMGDAVTESLSFTVATGVKDVTDVVNLIARMFVDMSGNDPQHLEFLMNLLDASIRVHSTPGVLTLVSKDEKDKEANDE